MILQSYHVFLYIFIIFPSTYSAVVVELAARLACAYLSACVQHVNQLHTKFLWEYGIETLFFIFAVSTV
jgi:uncharacterized protein involved in tolerance to divalent cations